MRRPRLSPAEEGALADFVAGARASFGTRIGRIVLFGSRARGEGRDDSDVDLLVEIDGATRVDRGTVIDIAADVGLLHHLVLSPIVADIGGLGGTHLAARIAADGIAL